PHRRLLVPGARRVAPVGPAGVAHAVHPHRPGRALLPLTATRRRRRPPDRIRWAPPSCLREPSAQSWRPGYSGWASRRPAEVARVFAETSADRSYFALPGLPSFVGTGVVDVRTSWIIWATAS